MSTALIWQYIGVLAAVCTVGSALGSFVGVAARHVLLSYRVGVLEKVIFGNGKPGLESDVATLKSTIPPHSRKA